MKKTTSQPLENMVITPLLFTTLIISICSIVYELIIGSLSSYLLGDSITQFSVTIGLYLFAMGLGSYFSKYIEKNLFTCFVSIEILVGVFGGFSSTILFVCYIYTQVYQVAMYILIIVIGMLVGLEIPLLVRIIENNGQSLKSGLANLFAFDYLGGLIGSILFPVLLLPKLGYISIGFCTGLMNLGAALIIVLKYKQNIKKYRLFRNIIFALCLTLLLFLVGGDQLTSSLEQGLYRDKIIVSKQTPYQKMIVTKHKDDVRLFLNGNVQFSSTDEYRYHEALVHVPMSFKPDAKKILLLGAGDGLAARELLKYDSIKEITIVDLDEQVVELCRSNKLINALNQNALSNNKVTTIYQDGYTFIDGTQDVFDMVIIDLPDPENESLSKLYSTNFYQLLKSRLSPNGIVVTQSSSPYYTTNAFWCINKTMEYAFEDVLPYHLYIPSFGDWGFNMASNDSLKDPDNISFNLDTDLKYLNADNFSALFRFGQDEKDTVKKLEVNTIFKPIISEYYQKDVDKW